MSFQKKLILALATSFIVLAYQNCGKANQPVQFSQGGASEAASLSDGNGHGYDGKVYVVLGALCSDSSNIQSKIVLKSSTAGYLLRKNCQDMTGVTLGANDFQLNVLNPDELTYSNQVFKSQVPTNGTVLNLTTAYWFAGFSYSFIYNFGTPADNSVQISQSKLLLFENGMALGPAHTLHTDIATYGLGSFSHWFDGTTEYIRFSASDNSNPATNGRIYSYKISN